MIARTQRLPQLYPGTSNSSRGSWRRANERSERSADPRTETKKQRSFLAAGVTERNNASGGGLPFRIRSDAASRANHKSPSVSTGKSTERGPPAFGTSHVGLLGCLYLLGRTRLPPLSRPKQQGSWRKANEAERNNADGGLPFRIRSPRPEQITSNKAFNREKYRKRRPLSALHMSACFVAYDLLGRSQRLQHQLSRPRHQGSWRKANEAERNNAIGSPRPEQITSHKPSQEGKVQKETSSFGTSHLGQLCCLGLLGRRGNRSRGTWRSSSKRM